MQDSLQAVAVPQASPQVPPDVYPESGYRLPLPRREDQDDEGRAVFDATIESAHAPHRGKSGPGGGMRGPAGIQQHSPRYRRCFQATNDFLRFESGLSPRMREIVILCTAREIDNQFEWTGHEPKAAREGVEPEVIDVIRARGPVDRLPVQDAAIVQLVREAISDEKVSSSTYARAGKLLSPQQLVNITGLIGHYLTVAMFLKVFDMQMFAERVPLLTPPTWRGEARAAAATP